MTRATLWRWVLSAKTFAAAMLALYVAFAMGMEKPTWSLLTVYAISQPLSGAIRSKGLFRFGGTLIGAVVAIGLAGAFAWSPGALTLALVAWVCACGYLGAMDRSPWRYLVLLAGITPIIIALPGVGDPANAFLTAVLRLQEIGLGVAAVLLVDAVVFPSSVAPVLGGSVDGWLQSAETWMLDALSEEPERRAASAADRRTLAADAARLDMLAVHLQFETAPELRPMAGVVAALRERALLLLPTLSAIEDEARELTGGGATLPVELHAFRDAFHAWVLEGSPPGSAASVKRSLQGWQAEPTAADPWTGVVADSLHTELETLVDLWADCRALQSRLAGANLPLSPHLTALVATARPTPHRDRAMAVWTVVAAALSFAGVATLWSVTQWPFGGAAAMLALMMPLFMSGMDDATPALVKMTKLMAGSSVFAAVYMYLVLPHVHSFPTLVLALAVALLPIGTLLSDPAKTMIALLPVAQISFENGSTGDFTTFANGVVASLIGLVIAAVVVALVRAVGADVSASRILRTGWAELAAVASAPRSADRRVFSGRMLDRLGLLVPRLAAVEDGHEIASTDALADLRTGLSLIALEDHRDRLAPEADRAVGEVLDSVAGHFRACARRGRPIPPPEPLLQRVDAALEMLLDSAAALAAPSGRPALLALAGVRRGIFRDAPPFRPRSRDPLQVAA